jgi:LmbE family N-acetylglucosaminyl deacetylase
MMKAEMESICVIGAHPDDFEILAGGLLARCRQEGAEITAIVVTDGSLGGDATLRRAETEAASCVIGVNNTIFLGMKDGMCRHEHDLIQQIERKICEFTPDLVITHSPNDTHQDHVNTSRCVLSAARRYPAILLGETASTFPPLKGFVSFDISTTLETKLAALRCHTSQLESAGGPLRLDEIQAVAIYRGSQTFVRYAEAFEVWKLKL